MKKQKPTKQIKSLIDRAIASRARGIARMEANKGQIMEQARIVMEQAQRECAEIDRRIANNLVLLDALKRGALKG